MNEYAVQFKNYNSAIKAFERLGISSYIMSDEDDTMFEVDCTPEQFDELSSLKAVVYTSEL